MTSKTPNPAVKAAQAAHFYVEAVEKPIFHPEMIVKMAQDFLRHLHFIG